MAKRIRRAPAWLEAPGVSDIYSVSPCISVDFTDFIDFWKHNGYWLFDTPGTICRIAAQRDVDLSQTTLFYYELYERQYNEQRSCWEPFHPEPAFGLDVQHPASAHRVGFDVATFSSGTRPECSPLSCNGLADRVETNSHCLLSSLEEARHLLMSGGLMHTEPGPFRIFAVYTAAWP
ncbi:MAG: hypothetical protein OQL28_16665 [Sedimenticola sp.]|nr:hypothetical protein [Sedimenticola sp.]